MASAKEYAEWIVSNQDKKGTDEFNTVATAYEQAKGMESSSTKPDAEPAPSPTLTAIEQAREIERLKDVPVDRTIGESSQFNIPTGFGSEGLGAGAQYQSTPNEDQSAVDVARIIPTVAASYLLPIERAGVIAASMVPAVTEFATSIAAGDTIPESSRNAIIAMYPGAKIKSAESLLPAAVKEFLKEGSRISGTIAIAETVKSWGEGNSFTSGLKKAIEPSNFTIPIAIASVVGPIRAASGKSSYMGKLAEEVKNDLRPLFGDDISVTAGMANPEKYAALETDFIQRNPNHPITEKMNKLGRDAPTRWARMFPDARTPADIAQDLQPSIETGRKLEVERTNLALLQQKNQDAQQRMIQAQQQGLGESQLAKIESEVIASEAAIVNQQARASLFDSNEVSLKGSSDAASTTQAKFVKATDQIFDLRSKAAAADYKATGVPFNQPFISVEELKKSVAAKTRGMQTPYRNQILASIDKAGGDSGMITLNQMKEMRANFGTDFNSTDVKSIDAFEKLANDAYSAITKRTQKIVESKFGAEAGKQLAAVNAWWGETSNLRNSKYMKQMMSGEPSKNMIVSLAKDIRDGNLQSVVGYAKFLDAVSKRAPDVADIGKTALIKTVREGFINLADDGSGMLDPDKLYKALSKASKSSKDVNKAFPIESLGFGNPEQIRLVNRTYRQYGLKQLSPEDLDDFYSNPLVRQALATGGDVSKLIKKSAAKSAFQKRVKEITALRAVGAKIEDADYNRALSYSKDAELSLEAQTKIVQDLEASSPLAQFMSGDGIGIPKSAGGLNTERSITNLLKGMPGKTQDAFIEATRQTNPKLLDDIKSRIVMDILPNISNSSGMNGHMWKIDMVAVQNLFKPIKGDASEPINMLEKLMPPEEFLRFKSKLPAFARLSKNAQSGGTTGMDFDLRNLGAAAATNTTGSKTSLFVARSILAELFNVTKGIKYRTAAKMLLNQEVAAKVLSPMQYTLPVTKAIQLQHDDELMAENMLKQKAP
jgi:hypothetical protein